MILSNPHFCTSAHLPSSTGKWKLKVQYDMLSPKSLLSYTAVGMQIVEQPWIIISQDGLNLGYVYFTIQQYLIQIHASKTCKHVIKQVLKIT